VISAIHSAVYCLVALATLTWLGNLACGFLLKKTGMVQSRTAVKGAANAGKLIGDLERLIIAAGVIIHSWEIVAGVIALKTIARFKELDKEINAEYFLVGSLFSLAWAILVSGLWLAYDHGMGNDLRAKSAELINPKDKDEASKRVQVQVSVQPVRQGDITEHTVPLHCLVSIKFHPLDSSAKKWNRSAHPLNKTRSSDELTQSCQGMANITDLEHD
jgi:hypothetical protein